MKTFMRRSIMPPLARIHSGVIRLSKSTMGCGLMYGNAGLVRCLRSGSSMLASWLPSGRICSSMLKKNLILRFLEIQCISSFFLLKSDQIFCDVHANSQTLQAKQAAQHAIAH